MKLLEVRDVHKSFGGNHVLKGVSFSVGEGEVLGIVGPNGSGKTTLLNVISGILRQDRGSLIFEGRDIGFLRPSARAKLGIGRTFQVTRLFSNLTVLENVLVPLHYGSPLPAGRRVAEELIELVGLSHKIREKAASLSLAQRKRLELARALALKPKLLLLDEVFAGLNPVSIREIVELLARLSSDKGITLILVEHVLKALFQLTGRVLVLSEGKLIFDGSPEGMVKNPEVIKAYLGERYAGEKGT
ncbi:amino acid/amide ABC transporter ATP-binding protein 1 (HAAT family) [Hydrogenivirga caldilitoris]|uniref:Amino acid/amide ABC transporter ATP-binding protein 1 (HAAT family) n=1 Tax=Hydrogenivirga caldilitoris TaxID=246264 RepID=A0A497XSL0_9AQUI|nr:ABC transporter ATP-binding protein [Hydrogenivirga caldilitoris]RLJ71241.1 amino acid/amide ABC transporter ATP-binding protein 1 (HAAT family) [Hydrogenivirga caldilitoris]